MKKKSIGVNAILNTIKTLTTVFFPLISFPYISRILGVDNLGNYNFCVSIINYFMLLAGLGVSTYAIREGARFRNDRNSLDIFVSEVFSINLIATIVSYLLLLICILFSERLNENKEVLGILSIAIIFKTFGCEWIFNIFEDFKYITIRAICFQFVSLILMFCFVQCEDDLIVYACITVLASSGANIVNYVTNKKHCSVQFIIKRNLLIRLVPILLIFANSIAVTIYVNTDITMIGIFAGNYATGLYTVSSKVYLIIKEILSAMIVVSIPRLSAYIGENKKKEFCETANWVLNMLLLLVVPAMVGIFSLSKNIIHIISGEEYLEANLSLKILSGALFCCIFSWFYTSCVLMPNKKEKKVLRITILAAFVNVVFNIIFIPLWGQNAAALTTLLSEGLSMILCYFQSKCDFRALVIRNDILSIIVGSIFVFLCCTTSIKYIDSLLGSTIVAVISSVIFYLVVLIAFKNSYLIYILDAIRLRENKTRDK